MKNLPEKGVVLIIVLIFTILLVIMAGVLLFLMTSQARLASQQIQRNKAYYVAEAGLQHGLERLRKGEVPPAIGWNITEEGLTAVFNASAPDQQGVRSVNSTVNY